MTNGEIIRMAVQAGFLATPVVENADKFERFAALVAEAEGKRLVNACEDARFEDGDGRHVEWYKGFDCCAATLNAERIETK